MKQFMVIEQRQNEKCEYFAVVTYIDSESKEALRKAIDETKPSWIKDKNYRIKEVEEINNG